MDPLSITAGVIAVATLAYNSSKALHDLIETYRDANETFRDLDADINGLSGVLYSLQTIDGEDGGVSLSQTQCHVLKATEVALKNCTDTLDAFKAKVNKLMSNSMAGDISKRDKFMLHFKRNDIAAFRIQLGSYKSTLTIALLVTSIKSSSKSNTELATKIEGVAGLLTGQMEGLKLAIQAVEDAGASSPSLMAGMKQIAQVISQCGDVCNAAVEVVPVHAGATFRSVQGFNEAKFMMASTNTQAIAEGSTRVFGEVIGRDRTRIWIGDTDAKTALEFMNS